MVAPASSSSLRQQPTSSPEKHQPGSVPLPKPSSITPQPPESHYVPGTGHPSCPQGHPGLYLLVSSGPEDGQNEDSGDGRSQVAGDSLDVDVELAAAGALQDGDPDHAEGHQHHRHHPASDSDTGSGSCPTRSITAAVRGPQVRGWVQALAQKSWPGDAGTSAGGCLVPGDIPMATEGDNYASAGSISGE